ncbi:MAG: orotidine-5'-phosphate decarboxylase [Verrucomicrobia bacterium]|nr:orotidine-5'-phosphate decarboxylase [Verrucomicrobiota bacterium]
MKPELIVALDVPSSDELAPILDQLGDEISFYKLGLELFCAEGLSGLKPIKKRGKKLFLDLKLHDIPRTVERAVRSAAAHGVNLLTVHACGGRAMLEAAAAAAAEFGEARPKLIAVTTLTSLNEDDLADIGITRSLTEQAVALGRLAMDSGIDGVVTSVHEAAALREALGDQALLVTPGIRLAGDAAEDQKRIATPSAAVNAGSNYLVVGRPILRAENPVEAAKAMRQDMEGGCP